jgi:hypothetical protein
MNSRRIGTPGRAATLVAILVALYALALPEARGAGLPRATQDRPDDLTGSQVHLMYVLPSDGVDRQLDTNGTLEGSASSFQAWLRGETGGRDLDIDTYQGAMDITFFQLSRTDAQIASYGAQVRDQIEDEVNAAGFSDAKKLYAVYYDGSSEYACGGGAWPPSLPGNVAAMYLLGEYGGQPPCSGNPFASASQPAGYMELAMLHEIVHSLGFAPTCAPNEHGNGHTSDSPTDLLYAGSSPWDIDNMVLDVGRDDYFEHSIAGCPDLADSGYMEGGIESPDAKAVSLSASRGRVRFGKRVTLSAAVSPCAGHEGDSIEFHKGASLLSSVASDSSCAASLSVKMKKTATFRAVSPQQDADHLAGESGGVKVKVKY